MTRCKAKIKARYGFGLRDIELAGWAHEGLFVHKQVEAIGLGENAGAVITREIRGEWKVSHIASGFQVAHEFCDERGAKELARRLAPLTDWRQPIQDWKPKRLAALAEKCLAAIGRWREDRWAGRRSA